jgi:hypothetical protein
MIGDLAESDSAVAAGGLSLQCNPSFLNGRGEYRTSSKREALIKEQIDILFMLGKHCFLHKKFRLFTSKGQSFECSSFSFFSYQ